MTFSDQPFVDVEHFAAPLTGLMSEPVPQEDRRHLARLVADTIAIAAYARRHGVGACGKDRTLAEPDGPAEIWGDGGRCHAEAAAFLNGTAAEALDFQEVFIDGRNNGHAAVVIVPALLALDAAHPDPERLERALRVAFLANGVLARALGRGHREGDPGFRTTSLTAPIAAALGGGVLIGDAAIAAQAAAISASTLPAGLLAAMAPSVGSFSVDKDISVGLSARHAVSCSLLAQGGATGPASAISGPRSWLASYGFGGEDLEALLTDPYDIDLNRYALKLFPANFGCQSAISLALELTRDLATEEIVSVTAAVKSSSAMSLSVRRINSHVAARFSLAYAVASAILRKRSHLADFEPPAIFDPEVLGFMEKITVEADEDFQAQHLSEGVFPCRLTLYLRNGTSRGATRHSPMDGGIDIDATLHAKITSLSDPMERGQLQDLAAGAFDEGIHSIFQTRREKL